MILTLGAALGHPAFLINLLSLRVPGESRAAIRECCVIHEMMCVFEETFLKTYMLEDIPKNSSKIREIWHHHHEGQEMTVPGTIMDRGTRKRGESRTSEYDNTATLLSKEGEDVKNSGRTGLIHTKVR